MPRDLSLVVAGQAGQGLQTITNLVTRILKDSGYYVFASTELMSRIRGGINTVQVRVADFAVKAPADRIDILVPLHSDALSHVARRIAPSTLLLGDAAGILAGRDAPCRMADVRIPELAKSAGSMAYANVVATGALLGLLGVPADNATPALTRELGRRGDENLAKELAAFRMGWEAGAKYQSTPRATLPTADPGIAKDLLISGSDAVGLGCAAGGCNFIASYPMSPGTGVLTFLYQNAKQFGIVAEQAEDEIAAINMAVGAWYAGARAMVTTSGGGFALMTEGVSLAGITETPVVVHIGQRPGPATGLPTRTEQGDLNLALYAGHGEFPRAIFAPRDAEDGFHLARRSFDVADRYQIPVFLLSDEFMLDSVYCLRQDDLSFDGQVERHVVSTLPDYKRYALDPTGISPRGVPGLGQGLVRLDSDEHTEEGQITESAEVRVAQNEKRLRKLDSVRLDIVPPTYAGPASPQTLVITWGTTHASMEEAWQKLKPKKIGWLHFTQVYPVHPIAKEWMEKAKQVVVVEGNATGQFAQLLTLETGVAPHKQLHKFDGFAHTVEEMEAILASLMGGR